MSNFYNNLPQKPQGDSASRKEVKLFDIYNSQSITVESATFDAMIAFFGSRGFEKDSAESTAYIIIKQAVLDNLNPFQLLDTLKGLDDVQLSGLITELLNYNRYKSSSLGSATSFAPSIEVTRNIVA